MKIYTKEPTKFHLIENYGLEPQVIWLVTSL